MESPLTIGKLQPQQIPIKSNSNGILKFINQQNSRSRPQGKKCNPYRQFGISSDAPTEFCTKNCLIADMAHFKQAKNKLSKNPQFYSQKNFFSIGHSSSNSNKQQKNQFLKQYQQSCSNNNVAFRRSSSKISKFYEKNAWMGDRFYVMGHQRSEKALQTYKTNVQINARSTKSLNFSRKRSMTAATSTRTMKLFPTHENMKQLFMSQKNKIRQMRNMLAKPQDEYLQSTKQEKRPFTSLQFGRSQLSRAKIDTNLKSKPRQFEVHIPEWGEKQFNVKFLQWNPQRNNSKNVESGLEANLLAASSKVAKFFSGK